MVSAFQWAIITISLLLVSTWYQYLLRFHGGEGPILGPLSTMAGLVVPLLAAGAGICWLTKLKATTWSTFMSTFMIMLGAAMYLVLRELIDDGAKREYLATVAGLVASAWITLAIEHLRAPPTDST